MAILWFLHIIQYTSFIYISLWIYICFIKANKLPNQSSTISYSGHYNKMADVFSCMFDVNRLKYFRKIPPVYVHTGKPLITVLFHIEQSKNQSVNQSIEHSIWNNLIECSVVIILQLCFNWKWRFIIYHQCNVSFPFKFHSIIVIYP